MSNAIGVDVWRVVLLCIFFLLALFVTIFGRAHPLLFLVPMAVIYGSVTAIGLETSLERMKYGLGVGGANALPLLGAGVVGAFLNFFWSANLCFKVRL